MLGFWYWIQSDLFDSELTQVDRLGGLIAAMIHDLGHVATVSRDLLGAEESA